MFLGFGGNRFGRSAFLMKEDDGGGGGKKEDERDDEPPRRRDPVVTAAKYNNDVNAMARHIDDLEADNAKVRRQRNRAQEELDTVKGKVPADGSVVLTKEQAAAWEAFQKLGQPEEVQRDLEAGRAAITKNAEYEHNQVLDDAARDKNWKPDLVKTLAKDVIVERREVDVQQQDGTVKKEPEYFQVTEVDGKKTEKLLADFFKEKGQDVFDSLAVGDAGHRSNDESHQHGGSYYPAQGAGGGRPAEYVPTNRYAHHLPKSG